MKSCTSPNDMKDVSFGYKKKTVCINLLLTFEVTADAFSSRFVSSGFHVVIYTTKTQWWMVNVMKHFMQVTCSSFTLLSNQNSLLTYCCQKCLLQSKKAMSNCKTNSCQFYTIQ